MSRPHRNPSGGSAAPPGQDGVDGVLTRCLERVGQTPELQAELAGSMPDFFVHGPPRDSVQETILAARRHLEWFLHERTSVWGSGRPLERMLEELDVEEAAGRTLIDSLASVFEIEEVLSGEGAWVRDLAGLSSHAIAEPAAAELFEVGDIIVGRLFPLERGLYHISRAAACFRDGTLREAFVADLARLREARGSKVMRMSQADLERMFFKPLGVSGGDAADAADAQDAQAASPNPAEAARTFLLEAGVPAAEVRRLLARLAASPFKPDQLLHGASDVLADTLDHLAFHTEADLDEGRKLLTQAWAALASGDSTAQVEPGAALAAFDQGREAGRDVEELFDDLERDLALSSGDDAPGEFDEGALSPAPDFPGVVGAMVEEFLWERDREGVDVAPLACLRTLGEFAQGIGVFEQLNASELLRFTAFWLLEQRALGSVEEARLLLDALRAFCAWSEEAHEHPLATEFGETLASLDKSLPRAVELNLALGRAAQDRSDTGELLHYLGADSGAPRVRDSEENEHEVLIPMRLQEKLRAGDPLRGRVQIDGSLSIYCCYPPQAVGLANP